jgi:aspartate dehydrogenase
MPRKLRVGLIGLGGIAEALIGLVEERASERMEVVGAIVRDPTRSDRPLPTFASAEELLQLDVDVVAELAGHEGLRDHGPAVLEAGKDLVFVAVGILADPDFERRFRAAAESSTGHARVATGVVGALDALGAAAVGNVDYVRHTIRWSRSSEFSAQDVAGLQESKEVFHGTAREAALAHPRRVNVTAAVSLAGIGFDRTEVRILLDPLVGRNVHLIEAEGDFGSLRFEMQPLPRSESPRGGKLVAMSVLHELIKQGSPVSVG